MYESDVYGRVKAARQMAPLAGAVAGDGGEARTGRSLRERTANVGKLSETAGRKARGLRRIGVKLAQLLIK